MESSQTIPNRSISSKIITNLKLLYYENFFESNLGLDSIRFDRNRRLIFEKLYQSNDLID